MTRAVRGRADTLQVHPPPAAEAQEAQDAAEAPADDELAQAETAQIEQMDAAEPGAFDKQAFVEAVLAAVDAQTPPNLEEAEEFADSGRPEAIGETVTDLMARQKESSSAPVETATRADLDLSVAEKREPAPLSPQPTPQVAAVDTAAAMPRPVPAEQTDLDGPKHEANARLDQAGVTEQQLAASNEPEFTAALSAKREAEQHSATAPGQFRTREAAVLASSRQQAAASGRSGLEGMQGSAVQGLDRVAAAKGETQAADEAKRAEVTSAIRRIFEATKTDVESILTALDETVASQFAAKEKAARDAFTADHTARMAAYKEERYAGLGGTALQVADWATSLPKEANDIYLAAKAVYETQMRRVVEELADTIGAELTRAKERIAAGRQEVAEYVERQPRELQQIAEEAAQDIGSDFDQLDADVDAKKQSLVDHLARSYVEARGAVDAEIEQMKEENKGLWDKATDAVGGAVETIGKLKDMLLGVLSRAAGAVEKIILDPIGFLEKFVNAVKTGVQNFAANIGEHLKKGLQGWLFGQLASAGVELPEQLDLKGIAKLVLSLLGLTWDNIKARVLKVIPEPVLNRAMQVIEVFQVLATEGVGGLWRYVVEKLTDLKEQVLGKIREFVTVEVIKAGIQWVIGLLNPAAAFVKACKMIYDAVMWFVDNAARLKDFVDSVLDSVESIASGGVGRVAGYIEQTLAKAVPMVISGMASLLGLGNVATRVRQIIEMMQKPVRDVVDKLIAGALRLARPLMGAAARGGRWVGNKAAAGRAWLRDKAQRVGEVLGLVKRPFKVGEEAHTLSVDMGTGAIRMASVEGPVEVRIRHYVAHANRRREREGLPPLPVEEQVAAVLSGVREARERIKKAGSGRGAVAQQQLDKLVTAVTELLIRIGGTGSASGGKVNGAIGNIARHGDQPSSNTKDPNPDLHLESEHVMPVRVVSLIFEYLGEAVPIKRPGPEDDAQRTIMVYKGAAKKKTFGAESADSALIRQLKRLARSGVPSILGRSKMARRVRAKLGLQGQKKVAERAALRAVSVRETLGAKLPAVAAARVQKTMQAIRVDHTSDKHEARGHTDPLPTEDQVRSAAALQATDVLELFVERMEK